MGVRRVKLIAALFLCLYAAALGHQVIAHHHEANEATTCGLCLLVFATVITATAFSLAFSCRPAISRPQPIDRHLPPVFSRIAHLRGPPRISR